MPTTASATTQRIRKPARSSCRTIRCKDRRSSVAKKKGKLRTNFRKNRGARPREKDFSRELAGSDSPRDAPHGERVSGKGDISRKRTLAGGEVIEDETGTHVLPDVDRTTCRLG